MDRCAYNAFVRVEKGQIKTGAMDSDALTGRLLKEIYMKTGPKRAKEFLDKATKMALEGIMMRGLTVSISDCELSKDTKKEIDKIIDRAEKDVDDLIEIYEKGELERVPGKTEQETFEDLAVAELGRAREECGKYSEKELSDSNSVLMAKTGAQGSLLNVTQMSSCFGQTALRGRRILRGYKNKSLPHFKDGDLSAEARGFIRSSFRDGFKPTEFFFHSMSGRDSLVDKGIRTGRSGYMQRRLINALLDISLMGDRSSRDSSGTIIQFRYGEDGADPMKCYEGLPVDISNLKR
jgi:DNA-directed RNA polymerase subunit A'